MFVHSSWPDSRRSERAAVLRDAGAHVRPAQVRAALWRGRGAAAAAARRLQPRSPPARRRTTQVRGIRVRALASRLSYHS